MSNSAALSARQLNASHITCQVTTCRLEPLPPHPAHPQRLNFGCTTLCDSRGASPRTFPAHTISPKQFVTADGRLQIPSTPRQTPSHSHHEVHSLSGDSGDPRGRYVFTRFLFHGILELAEFDRLRWRKCVALGIVMGRKKEEEESYVCYWRRGHWIGKPEKDTTEFLLAGLDHAHFSSTTNWKLTFFSLPANSQGQHQDPNRHR